MITINDYKYYQPQYEDGEMPEGLWSFQAFQSEQEAIDWAEKHLDGDREIEIHEYCNDDIEDVTLIDSDGDIIPKIEDLSDEEIEGLLTDEVEFFAGSIDNLHATRQSNETEDQFKDRVYDDALDEVNAAIIAIEEHGEYNFQAYCGTPDVEWYDEARDEAVRTVMDWMLEDYPY